MKYACFTVILLLFTSCDYLDAKKTSSDDILNEELRTFNWNELDVYPTFSSCDSAATKTEKKHCFETELTNHIRTFLEDQHFVVGTDVSDTLVLTFTISEKGKIEMIETKVKPETLKELPDIKGILQESTTSLPEIFPAIKRGQQVSSQFMLPVVIAVD